MKQPNIIFIMTDQMRGDCLGAAGHPDVKTPYLDTLAARGVLFDHAYSACPSCIPARAAIHTGLSQLHHGRVGYQDMVDWDYPVTMAGELSKAGYHTQCVGKMHVHPLRSLLGFHNVVLHDGYLHSYRYPNTPYYESQKVADDYFYWLKNEKGIEADVTDTGLECNSWVARPWIYEEKYHPTNWVTTNCIDFLRRRDTTKPFFLMASYLRPHPPFDAPAYYFDLYKDKPLAPPSLGSWETRDGLKQSGRIFDSATGPVDPELVRQAQIGYYACITHLDHQIGRLIQALVEHEVYDNSIIVFTSDHGEELCDHHLFRKSRPYQGSIHVPMIISGKEELLGGKTNTKNHALVELRDIMPTLLEAAHAPVPESLDGESMLGLVRGEKPQIREWLHGEHEAGIHSNHFIVTERDKYIWYSQTGAEQYFDLEKDPHELENLIGSDKKKCQKRIGELRNRLIQSLDGRPEGYSDGERLIVGCQTTALL